MRFKLLCTLLALIVAAALVRGAADTTAKKSGSKEGFIDSAIDKVKEKMFGIPHKDIYKPEEHTSESLETKVDGVLHSGKEAAHHAHETIKKASDVAGTAGNRAKDAIFHRHTHDDETISDMARDKYEQAKNAAKDTVNDATRDPTLVDRVKDFLHMRKDPIDATRPLTSDTIVDKAKHMAEDAGDAIRDAVRNTDYASDDNRDYDTTNRPKESLLDKAKEFLHLKTAPTATNKNLMDKAKDVVDDTLGRKGTTDSIIDKAKQMAENAGEAIKEYATDAEELVGGTILANKAKNVVADAKDAVKSAARDANRMVQDTTAPTGGHAHDNVTLRPTMATTADESLVDKVKEFLHVKKGDSVVDTAKDAMQAGYEAVKDADQKVMDKVKDFVQVARDDAEWVADEVKGKVNKLASDGRKKIGEMADSDDNIRTRAEDARNSVLSAAQTTRDHAKDAAEWTKDRVNEGVDKAKVLVDTLKAKAGTTAEEVAARMGKDKDRDLEDDGRTTLVDNNPDVQDVDTGKTLLGRAKDALRKCFARSKATNELVEVECDKDQTPVGAAGVYETAKEGVEDTIEAAKDGIRNTVHTAKEGAKNTAGAARDAAKSKRVEA